MKIMIVEDNQTMRLGMEETLKRLGHEIETFSNGESALKELESVSPRLVITDLRMGPINGLELLAEVKKRNKLIEVIMVSAYGSIETAVEAVKKGAADFITKPFPPDELRIRVNKIEEKIKTQNELEDLREKSIFYQDELNRSFQDMIGQSPPMRELFDLIIKISKEDSTICISGESGTGKELAAHAIHANSSRKNQPFIRVNCGALNDNLLESELFGHEKGAFTGAVKSKKGRFELAHKGTLFLDEIGDISPLLQVKLLRVLQEREFERVGGEKTIKTNVRVICATNKNLLEETRQNHFREDLYYRLSVIPIEIPPLRKRKEDIPLLIDFFLNKLSNGDKSRLKSMDDEGKDLLSKYSWPGNVRELRNIIERLFVISPQNEIPSSLIANQLNYDNSSSFADYEGVSLDEALYHFEKDMIEKALKKCGGVKNQAAKILGINTSTLYYKLDKFKL